MESEKQNIFESGMKISSVNSDTPKCAGCESLKQMVRALSALVDIQELPCGFTIENYKRLLAGKPIRMRRPVPVVRVKSGKRKITA